MVFNVFKLEWLVNIFLGKGDGWCIKTHCRYIDGLVQRHKSYLFLKNLLYLIFLYKIFSTVSRYVLLNKWKWYYICLNFAFHNIQSWFHNIQISIFFKFWFWRLLGSKRVKNNPKWKITITSVTCHISGTV